MRSRDVIRAHGRCVQPDSNDALHLRMALLEGLAQPPPRQRAVLVLRYWEQLSESEAVDVLGCSLGTVKSSASRGLARLRDITAPWTAKDAPSPMSLPHSPPEGTRAIEDELSAAMRQQVAGLTPAADIVARTVRRHRRRIRIRLGVAITGAAGITAIAVAVSPPGALSRAGSPGPGAAGPGATAPPRTSPGAIRVGGPLPSSPRARLLVTMTRSAQLSYRLHLLNLSVLPGHKTTGPRCAAI